MATDPAGHGHEATATTSRFGTRLHSASPTMRAVLRIGAGLLFMQHGAQKLLGMFGGVDQQGGTVELMSQMGVAGVLELVGGLMIVIGLFTRPVALILMVEMLAAFVIAHLPRGGMPVENGGELPLLYALVWAYFAAAGAGPASVDSAMGGRGSRTLR